MDCTRHFSCAPALITASNLSPTDTHTYTHTRKHTTGRGGNGWQRVTNIGQNVYCCVARCCVWFDCCLPCHHFVRPKTSSLNAIPFQYALCSPARYLTMFGELRNGIDLKLLNTKLRRRDVQEIKRCVADAVSILIPYMGAAHVLNSSIRSSSTCCSRLTVVESVADWSPFASNAGCCDGLIVTEWVR